MNQPDSRQVNLADSTGPHFELPDPTASGAPETESKQDAWEEVAPGRFMPRRIRGSLQGRALG